MGLLFGLSTNSHLTSLLFHWLKTPSPTYFNASADTYKAFGSSLQNASPAQQASTTTA